MPGKLPEFIKFNTIKDYVNDKLKLRSTDDAAEAFIKAFNKVITQTVKDAGKLAKDDKRVTIQIEDVETAIEKNVGDRDLSWQETAEQVIKQNPADLGKISKHINDYITGQQ